MANQYTNPAEYKSEWDVLYIKCTKCKQRATAESYQKDVRRKFWVSSICKKCRRLYTLNQRDKINERLKIYYINNKDVLKEKVKKNSSNHTNELWFNRETFHRRARQYANNHKLKPDRCPICWKIEPIEMHHPSYKEYSDWSKVVFCCKFCHRNIHLWLLECPNIIDLLECDSPIKEAVR